MAILGHLTTYIQIALLMILFGCGLTLTHIFLESLIQQSQAGYIVSDGLPHSLAGGIQSIIRNSKLPPAAEIRKSVLEYSWSNVASAILGEYETVMQQGSFESDRLISVGASCG